MALRIFSAFVLVLASIFYVPTASAQTTNNDGYRVDSVQLKPYPDSLSPEGALYAWSGLDVEFEWSAPVGGVQAGDEFIIQFPKDAQGKPVLALRQSNAFDLVDQFGAAGGSCIATETEVRCNPDGRFVGKDNVHGTIRVAAAAREANAELKTYEFTIGSGVVRADVPGGKGVTGRPSEFPESEYKVGWSENDGKTLTWALYIPGSKLQDLGGGPLELTDTIPADGGAHSFKCAPNQGYIVPQGPGNFRVQALGYDKNVTNVDQLDSQAENHLGVYDQQFNNDYTRMDLKIHAPANGWNPDHVYRVKYHTCFTEHASGSTFFKNNAVGRGLNLGTATAEYKDEAEGTIRGSDRQTFELTKKLAADSAPMPEGYKFKFKVDIDSDNDAFDKSISVELAPNETYKGKDLLPAGTKVTVTEENPTRPGLTFDAPIYEANPADNPVITADGITVKTHNDKNAHIVVTNRAKGPLVPLGGGGENGSSVGSSDGLLLAGLLAIPLIAGVVGSSAVGSSAVGSSPVGSSNPTPAPGPAPQAPASEAPMGNGAVTPSSAVPAAPAKGTPAKGAVAKDAPAKGAPATQKPSGMGGGAVQQQAQPTAKAEKTLANTGVRVIEIFAIALGIMILGIALVIRSRRRAR